MSRWERVWKAIPGTKPTRYRRVWRDRSHKATALRALRLAQREIGTTEDPPGSNRTRYGREWRQNGVPWCGLAVASWWRRAGFNVPRDLALQIDYVPTLVQLAKERRHRLAIVHPSRVRPGDAVAFDFDGGSADHVGLFEAWIDRKAGVFTSIEGNTAIGNDSNGGEVMRRTRRLEQVEAFVRKLPG
jgi:hypothetical protein